MHTTRHSRLAWLYPSSSRCWNWKPIIRQLIRAWSFSYSASSRCLLSIHNQDLPNNHSAIKSTSVQHRLAWCLQDNSKYTRACNTIVLTMLTEHADRRTVQKYSWRYSDIRTQSLRPYLQLTAKLQLNLNHPPRWYHRQEFNDCPPPPPSSRQHLRAEPPPNLPYIPRGLRHPDPRALNLVNRLCMIIYGTYMIIYGVYDHIWIRWDHVWTMYDHVWSTTKVLRRPHRTIHKPMGSTYDSIWSIYTHKRTICDHIWSICLSLSLHACIHIYIYTSGGRKLVTEYISDSSSHCGMIVRAGWYFDMVLTDGIISNLY